VAGFGLTIAAIHWASAGWLFVALTIVVVGFAFMMPSLNALVSRRTDPARQGSILGVGQSISSLARILGPVVGIPLLARHSTLPYWVAGGLMALGFVLVAIAARSGQDFQAG
jgi:hypothetical protein